MEAEYGKFVFTNYQYQPWRGIPSPNHRVLIKPNPKVVPTTSQPRDQALPVVQKPSPSPPPAVHTPPVSATPPLSAAPTPLTGPDQRVFRLAPPPQTANICSVGSMSTEAEATSAGSLFIESLIEEKAAKATPSNGLDFDGPLAPQDDDEELLLGDDGVAAKEGTGGFRRKHSVPDGVDSASESEVESPPADSMPPPPPHPAQPSVPARAPQVPALGMLASAAMAASEVRGAEAPSSAALVAPRAAEAPLDWGKRFGSMAEVDSQLNSSLDRFFSDENQWQRVAKEVSSTRARFHATMDKHFHSRQFRVQVPKPYPGVQYRKSKCLDDRYPRYAKHGCTVTGEVESDGEWLRISGNVFLPMKVGTISILEPLQREAGREATTEEDRSARWWACGPGSGGEPVAGSKETAEVVVNQDGYLNIPEGLNQQLPWEEKRQEVCTVEANPQLAVGSSACSLLPEHLPGSQFSNLEAASRILADPINPFSDTPRGGSPADSPLRSRPVSMHA